MRLKFKNGKFTVLQVSDAQDLQHVRPAMTCMLDKAYDTLKPDLVVLTGDNILGNHLRDCWPIHKLLVDSKEKEYEAMRTAIRKVVMPIARRSIPFAMIYGNHDDMNEITKDEQADIFRLFSGCIGLDGQKNGQDCDTYNVPIYSEDGQTVKFNLWMFDSSWCDKETGKCHGYIKEEAVEWYKRTSADLTKQNGGTPVPSILFQHIPPTEVLSFVRECGENEDGVSFQGKRFRLNDGIEGSLGEYPAVTEKDTGLFRAMKDCGDVKAVVFGHDHLNSFETSLDGIDYIQTPCASFRCYGDRNRGVRLFTIYENGEYETRMFTYDDLCGKGLLSRLRYFRDADELARKRGAVYASAAAFAAAAGTAAAIKRLCRDLSR